MRWVGRNPSYSITYTTLFNIWIIAFVDNLVDFTSQSLSACSCGGCVVVWWALYLLEIEFF